MRLLHSQTLEFKEFFNQESTPPYAILSHTWGDEEVTFRDMRKYLKAVKKGGAQKLTVAGGDDERTRVEGMSGFKKIQYCAKQAARDYLQYFWVDTCCIDKSSSAELSEAINSMFRWYQSSKICYAYLSDVFEAPNMGRLETEAGKVQRIKGTLRKSRWFTRGWTLQELIAPRALVFYTANWTEIGAKTSLHLAAAIEDITRIPNHVLSSGEMSRFSIAQKMNWAASRQTTRVEDRAYSLLGIFEVHMPLLYGEGDHAFVRLQQEIIGSSDDLSILAWKNSKADKNTYRGLLAKSPSEFAHCEQLRWERTSMTQMLQVTTKDVKAVVELIELESSDGLPGDFVAKFPGVVGYRDWVGWDPVGIFLRKTSGDHFIRVNVSKIFAGHSVSYAIPRRTHKRVTVCVRHNTIFESSHFTRPSKIMLQAAPEYAQSTIWTQELVRLQVWPSDGWDESSSTFSFDGPEEVPETGTVVDFSFSFRKCESPFVFSLDRTKHLTDCIAVDKPWGEKNINVKSPRFNSVEIEFRHSEDNEEVKVMLALVLIEDKCVLEMSVYIHG